MNRKTASPPPVRPSIRATPYASMGRLLICAGGAARRRALLTDGCLRRWLHRSICLDHGRYLDDAVICMAAACGCESFTLGKAHPHWGGFTQVELPGRSGRPGQID